MKAKVEPFSGVLSTLNSPLMASMLRKFNGTLGVCGCRSSVGQWVTCRCDCCATDLDHKLPIVFGMNCHSLWHPNETHSGTYSLLASLNSVAAQVNDVSFKRSDS